MSATRTSREHRLDRAVAMALRDAGSLPEALLIDELGLRVRPAPLRSEATEAIRHADSTGRIVGIQGETGPRYKLTEDGRLWMAEHGI